MPDADVAVQRSHVPRAEHIAYLALAFVHVKCTAFGSHHAGRVLPAMLEHQQAVVQELTNRRFGYDADDSTHLRALHGCFVLSDPALRARPHCFGPLNRHGNEAKRSAYPAQRCGTPLLKPPRPVRNVRAPDMRPGKYSSKGRRI